MFYVKPIKIKLNQISTTQAELLQLFNSIFGQAAIYKTAVSSYPQYINAEGSVDYSSGVKDVTNIIARKRELPDRCYFSSKAWKVKDQVPEFGIMIHYGINGYHTLNFSEQETQELSAFLHAIKATSEIDILLAARDIARYIEKLGGKYTQPEDQWWGNFKFTLPVDLTLAAKEYNLPIENNWIECSITGEESPLDIRRFKQSLNILVDSASQLQYT